MKSISNSVADPSTNLSTPEGGETNNKDRLALIEWANHTGTVKMVRLLGITKAKLVKPNIYHVQIRDALLELNIERNTLDRLVNSPISVASSSKRQLIREPKGRGAFEIARALSELRGNPGSLKSLFGFLAEVSGLPDGNVVHPPLNTAEISWLPQDVRDVILAKYAVSDKTEVRRTVAQHPYTQPLLLKKLAQDADNFVVRDVASNTSTLPSTISEIANRSEHPASEWALQNPSIELHTLDKIAASTKDPHKLLCIAINPSASTQVLEKLATEKDTRVRETVGFHPSTPVSIIQILSKDQNASVRWGVAKNPKLPEEFIRVLANDSDKIVREMVSARADLASDTVEQLLCDREHMVRARLARNPILTRDQCSTLAEDKSSNVRWALTKNPNIPAVVLALLLTDSGESIRRYAAQHPKASLAIQILRTRKAEMNALKKSGGNEPLEIDSLAKKIGCLKHPKPVEMSHGFE